MSRFETPERAETGSPSKAGPPAWLAVVLLAAIVLVAFGPTLGYGFVWDDHEQIVDNLRLRDPSSLGEFWRSDVLGSSRDDGERSNYWRPLFFSQYLAVYQLVELNSTAWHAGAVLHHVLACLAVWWLLVQLGFARGLALAAAALFAVHPAHGESISWLAAAYNDPPATTLILTGLIGWIAWRRDGGWWRVSIPTLCFAAALTLKESALSMLLLVPLVDLLWTWRQGDRSMAVAEESKSRPASIGNRGAAFVVGLAVLALVFAVELLGPTRVLTMRAEAALAFELAAVLGLSVLGVMALGRLSRKSGLAWGGSDSAVPTILGFAPLLAVTVLWIYVRKLAIGTVFGVDAGGRALTEILPTLPWLAVWYLRFLLWPFGLAPSYPVRYLDDWSDPRAWGSALFLLALAGALAWWARRRPIVLFSLAWIAACIWPVFNTRSFRPAYLVHQRYLYLAVLGLCLLIAWGLWRWRSRLRWPVLAVLLISWTGSVLYSNRFWSSDEALWQRVTEVDPGNPAAFDWLGLRALERGEVDRAEELFEGAIAADPDSPQGHCNLALLTHTQRRRPDRSLVHYQRGLAAYELKPHLKVAERQQCRIHYAIALASTGRAAEAADLLVEVADSPPFPVLASRNAAVLLRNMGRLSEAEALLERALTRHPAEATLAQMLRQLRAEAGQN